MKDYVIFCCHRDHSVPLRHLALAHWPIPFLVPLMQLTRCIAVQFGMHVNVGRRRCRRFRRRQR